MDTDRNIVKNPELAGVPDGWSFATPRPGLAPGHSVRDVGNHRTLVLSSTDDPLAFGCWRCELDLQQGHWYKASVRVRTSAIENPSLSVFAQVADHFLVPKKPWENDNLLEQVFLYNGSEPGRDFELYLRAARSGEIEYYDPRVVEIEKPPARMVRVATAHFSDAPAGLSVAGQLDRISQKLDQAGASGPDICCLPEYCPIAGVPEDVYESLENVAEEVDTGSTCKMLADKARTYSMYVLAGIVERHGRYLYNSAVLFDRHGSYIGCYRKTHPMFAEQKLGISSGDSYPVFDLDFGRIAIHICYDEWFPEVARYYAHSGVEILFLPVAGGKPITWRTRALDNGIYFVSSSVTPPSMIISSTGEIIAETHGDGVAVADLDLANRQVNWYKDPTLAYSMPCTVPQMRNVLNHQLLDDLAGRLRDAWR